MAKDKANGILIHVILIVVAFVMIVPFLWMFLTAFKTIGEATSINPFVIFPSSWKLDSFLNVWKNYNFLVLYKNTLLMIFFRVVCAVLTATMVDGCNYGQRFLLVMAPLTRSAMVSLGIFTAVFAFKDLMWPMIVCSEASTTTLSAALAKMQGQFSSNYPELMAAALMACLPMIIIYVIFQKQFVEGIATSGGKL